jgi:hypothetical protein
LKPKSRGHAKNGNASRTSGFIFKGEILMRVTSRLLQAISVVLATLAICFFGIRSELDRADASPTQYAAAHDDNLQPQ